MWGFHHNHKLGLNLFADLISNQDNEWISIHSLELELLGIREPHPSQMLRLHLAPRILGRPDLILDGLIVTFPVAQLDCELCLPNNTNDRVDLGTPSIWRHCSHECETLRLFY